MDCLYPGVSEILGWFPNTEPTTVPLVNGQCLISASIYTTGASQSNYMLICNQWKLPII